MKLTEHKYAPTTKLDDWIVGLLVFWASKLSTHPSIQ